MTVAPNGVAIADYDPKGIGAIAMCSITRANHQADINFGDIVDANAVQLFEGGVFDNGAANGNHVVISGPVLPGSWMCLGYMLLSDANVTDACTLFMRVS